MSYISFEDRIGMEQDWRRQHRIERNARSAAFIIIQILEEITSIVGGAHSKNDLIDEIDETLRDMDLQPADLTDTFDATMVKVIAHFNQEQDQK